VENTLNHAPSIINNNNELSDQRSQIVSSTFNRFPFLGSFKRQRSEVCIFLKPKKKTPLKSLCIF
jgi:hypothetical protein